MNPTDIHLIFFLSRATPLTIWDKIGILDREIALYKKLHAYLGDLSIVTGGGAEELAYQDHLSGIRILYNRWGLSPNAYSLLAPFLHWKALRSGTVYKTNQLDGAWTAIIAGKVHRRPVIVRAGYLWAEHFRWQGGRGLKAVIIDSLEAFSFKGADAVLLTTETMKQQVIERYSVQPEKISIVPNYVDTERFHPMPEVESVSGRVCYVGRLVTIKNLRALVRAI